MTSWRGRDRYRQEVEAEIQDYLELRARELEAQGMDPDEAWEAAVEAFGDPDAIEAAIMAQRERRQHARSVRAFVARTLQDVRYAARFLARNKLFSGVAIGTLALGIGATVSVFSVVQGVLLTPPPYEDPEELTLILPTASGAEPEGSPAWTAEQWLLWEEQSSLVESFGAYSWTFNYLVSDQGSQSIEGMWVDGGYFETLGITPALGRVFDETETGADGAPKAIVLGHELWMSRYAGDPAILGQTVPISRQWPSPTVVGVMPPGIRFLPSPGRSDEPGYDADGLVDYWMPMQPNTGSEAAVLQSQRWNVVARLADGVDPDAARAEVDALVRAQSEANPAYAGMVPRVERLGDFINREGERVLLPLLAASILVLLIACGNAAALLLVRGLRSEREYGVRGAIGAGRSDLVRLVAAESVLISLIGGVSGAGLAVLLVASLKRIGGAAIPRLDAVSIGWPVLGFGIACAVAAVVLAGMYPALRASRASPGRALGRASTRTGVGRAERRLLSSVTAAQTALTLAVLVGAGLLLRTMVNLHDVDTGYETDRILTMAVTSLAQGDWDEFHSLALERASRVPGVDGAAFVWGVPLTGEGSREEVVVEGAEAQDAVTGSTLDRSTVPVRGVTSGYFDLMDMTIVEGRDFHPIGRGEEGAVATVNESFVDRYLSGGSAIGRSVVLPAWNNVEFRIVGVVRDGRTDELASEPQPALYNSLWQVNAFTKHLVVRTGVDPGVVTTAVMQALRDVDPTVAVERARTLEDIRRESIAARRFATRILVGFGFIACLLTLAGIYGVLSLSVASRRRELAVRSAIGADRRSVLRLMMGEGVRVIAIGLAAGAVASLVLSRLLGSLLFEVEPTDPLTLAAMAALLTGVALLASWIPARRAAATDPMKVLREE